MSRVNLGCGQRPTPGWINYDNALTARFARVPLALPILRRLGLLTDLQHQFMRTALVQDIRYADAVRRIPEADLRALTTNREKKSGHLLNRAL